MREERRRRLWNLKGKPRAVTGSPLLEPTPASTLEAPLSFAPFDNVKSARVVARDMEALLRERLSKADSRKGTAGVRSLLRDEAHATADTCEAHLGVFREFIDTSTVFKPVLQAVHGACADTVASLRDLTARCAAMKQGQQNMKLEYVAIANDLRASFAEKSAVCKTTAVEAQRGLARAQKEAEQLRQKEADMRAQLAAAQTKLEEEEKQQKASQKTSRDMHEALRELQHRSQTVMEENAALRRIAQYNEDLLNELEDMKVQVAQARAQLEQEQRRAGDQGSEAARRLHRAKEVVKNLAWINTNQLTEIQELQAEAGLQRSQVLEAEAGRDALLQTHTPRPFTGEAPGETSTRQKFARLISENEGLKADLDATVRRAAVAENVAAFLKADAEALTQSFDAPVVAGRTFVGLGRHPLVPAYLHTAVGPVRQRPYTPADLRALLRELEAWVDRQDAATRSLHSDELFHAWVASKGSAEMQAEIAYSMIDASERMKAEPDLTCLQRWVRGDLSLQTMKCVGRCAAVLLEGLTKAEEGTGRAPSPAMRGIMKRKALWEHVVALCGTRSDVELLRLRNALQRDMSKQTGVSEHLVRFDLLFVDETGASSDFVTVLRELQLHDADEVRAEWEGCVFATGVEHCGVRYTSAVLLAEAFAVVDAALTTPAARLANELVSACSSGSAGGAGRPPAALDVVSAARRQVHLVRRSKKIDGAAQKRPAKQPLSPAALAAQEELRAQLDRLDSPPPTGAAPSDLFGGSGI